MQKSTLRSKWTSIGTILAFCSISALKALFARSHVHLISHSYSHKAFIHTYELHGEELTLKLSFFKHKMALFI